MTDSTLPPAASLWGRFDGWFLRPARTVLSPDIQRRARLMASLALTLVVLLGIRLAIGFRSGSFRTDPSFFLIYLLQGSMVAAYLTSRTRWIELSVFLFVIGITLLPYGVVILRNDPDPLVNLDALVWVLPGFFFGAVLFSWRLGVLWMLGNFAGLLAFTTLSPLVGLADVDALVYTLFVLLASVAVLNRYRTLTEQDRQAELLAANHQLKDLTTALEQRVEARTRDLTQAQTRAEERAQALAQAQARTEGLLIDLDDASRLARLASFELELSTQTLIFSDRFYELLGTTAQAEDGYRHPIEASVRKFVHPQDADRMLAEVQALFGAPGTAPLQLEYRIQRREGDLRYLSFRFQVERDAFGQAAGAKGAAQDITERKQAEEAVRESETRLQTLVEFAPEAIVVVDLTTGLFTEPNVNAERLYGLSRADLLKVGPAQMSPPTQPDGRDSTEKAMEKIGEAMQGGAPVFEWLHRNAAGQDIPCEIRLVRLPSASRPLVRASVTDITARKQAEAIIAKRAAELETVTQLSTSIASIQNPQDMLQAVVDLVKPNFNLYHAHIYLLNDVGDTLALTAGAGEVGRIMVEEKRIIPLTREQSLVARAARTAQAVVINDVTHAPDFLPNPLLPHTRAELAVPVMIAGAVLGVLDVQSDTADYFTPADVQIQTILAAQIAVALQNARSFERSEKTLRELNAMTRRLTREGWQTYLPSATDRQGYVYEQGELAPVRPNGHPGSEPGLMNPLIVRGETIGRIATEGIANTEADAALILDAVTQSLGAHLDNLRLSEQTQQRAAELQDATAFLDSVIENLPVMLFVKEAEALRFLRWNKAGEDIIGFSRDVMLGKNDYDFFPKAEADFFVAKDRDVLTQGTLADIPEESIQTRHRGQRLLHTRKIPIYDAQGRPKYLLGISEDITERKQAEKALAQRANELETVSRVSAATSTILNATDLLLAVVNLTKTSFNLYHAHIYLMNEAGNALHLTAGAGLVGEYMVSEGRTIPADWEQSLVAKAARTRQAIIANDVRLTPDFLPHPLLPETRSEMAVPMIAGDRVMGVFDVQSDQVEHFTQADVQIQTALATQVAIALQNARLYAEQTATVTRLRELDQLKSSFLANMSHELRTPLNSILGFTEVILEELDGPLTSQMDNDLRIVYKNGQHLLSLINDVLDMAKIESGTLMLHAEILDVVEILQDVITLTSALARAKSLEMELDTDAGPWILNADRIRLRQVIINLVNNAIKFTETGQVTLRALRRERVIRVEIQDTGLGIPAQLLEPIFQEFTQVDTTTTRKVGGTGLGLPISRRLVELHGGKLWAESTGIPGEGSTFIVEFPTDQVYATPVDD